MEKVGDWCPTCDLVALRLRLTLSDSWLLGMKKLNSSPFPITMCVCMYVCMYQCMRTMAECLWRSEDDLQEFRGSNWGLQAWWHVPLPTEPFCSLFYFCGLSWLWTVMLLPSLSGSRGYRSTILHIFIMSTFNAGFFFQNLSPAFTLLEVLNTI